MAWASSATQGEWEAYFCGSYIKPRMNQNVSFLYSSFMWHSNDWRKPSDSKVFTSRHLLVNLAYELIFIFFLFFSELIFIEIEETIIKIYLFFNPWFNRSFVSENYFHLKIKGYTVKFYDETSVHLRLSSL